MRRTDRAGLVAIPQNALRRRLQPRPTLLTSFVTQHSAAQTPAIPLATTTKTEEEYSRQNKFFRDAFIKAPDEVIAQKLSSPFVPPVRDYPSQVGTTQSAEDARRSARAQAGLDTIWSHYKPKEHFLVSDLKWTDTLDLLRQSTRHKINKSRQMSAMRIVLPGNWDLEVSNRSVDFIDSSSGLRRKLRIYNDHRNPSAIIVRGTRRALAKAAEELLKGRSGIKIFQLGQVASCDYETKQLWPKIQAQDKNIPVSQYHSLWIHREHPEEHWIDTKYEDIPKPSTWTAGGFDSYITKLVCGRLRPHLIMPLYGQQTKNEGRAGHHLDTDGIRIKLIMDAFMDPEARPHITTPILKMALAFMAHRGGHRATADRLFTHAEEWGLPMDTETFNIMLEGYVTKRDHRYFYLFLRKMTARYYQANARTWLLFLRLVEKDFEKRQIVAAIWELGLFKDPGLSRAVAGTMTSLDAYAAFRSGMCLEDFMRRQKGRYGDQWLSKDALNAVLREYLRFYGESRLEPAEYTVLIDQFQRDGHSVSIDTVNLILENCVVNQDWNAAVWALHLMWRDGCDADHVTYGHIIKLAINTSSPHALAAGFFYGALDYHLRTPIRYHLKKVFFGRHSNEFWDYNQVPIFTAEIAAAMKVPDLPQSTKAHSRAISVVNAAGEGMVPTQPLAVTMASAVLRDRELKRGGKPKPLEIGMRKKTASDEADELDDLDERPTTIFRLDTCFDPMTMVAGWRPRPRKEKLRPGPGTTLPLKGTTHKSPQREAPDMDPSNEAAMDDAFLKDIQSARREM